MKALLAALFCGVLFGVGMVVSDMINPARVIAFLDIAGDWDPALALVMGGALVPSGLAYAVRRRMARPVLAQQFHVPAAGGVDRPLLLGAALFGIGWGLAGLCPGPAIAALITGQWQILLFVTAMFAGMAIQRVTQRH